MYEIRDGHNDVMFEGTLTECAEYILENFNDTDTITLVASTLSYA